MRVRKKRNKISVSVSRGDGITLENGNAEHSALESYARLRALLLFDSGRAADENTNGRIMKMTV